MLPFLNDIPDVILYVLLVQSLRPFTANGYTSLAIKTKYLTLISVLPVPYGLL